MFPTRRILLICLLASLAGCGNKGPLTRPVPAPAKPAAPAVPPDPAPAQPADQGR